MTAHRIQDEAIATSAAGSVPFVRAQFTPTKTRQSIWLVLLVALLVFPESVAAAGWYLVVPPPDQEHDAAVGGAAAVNNAWQIRAPFDTAEECRVARQAWIDSVSTSLEHPARHTPEELVAVYLQSRTADQSQCAASGDPRLLLRPAPLKWHLVYPSRGKPQTYSTAARCEQAREDALQLAMKFQARAEPETKIFRDLTRLIELTQASKCVDVTAVGPKAYTAPPSPPSGTAVGGSNPPVKTVHDGRGDHTGAPAAHHADVSVLAFFWVVIVAGIVLWALIRRRSISCDAPAGPSAGRSIPGPAMPPFQPAPVPAVPRRPPPHLFAAVANPLPLPPSRYPGLLAAVLGDREKAERLIEYERRFKPGASREALIDAALDRLEWENRR